MEARATHLLEVEVDPRIEEEVDDLEVVLTTPIKVSL
jgi:hypothetical protein